MYRVKTTIKELPYESITDNKVHNYEATKIELLAGQHGDVSPTSPRNSNNSISVTNLLNGVEKSYEKEKNLLDSSKIVDENGEPLEVCHVITRHRLNSHPLIRRFFTQNLHRSRIVPPSSPHRYAVGFSFSTGFSLPKKQE